MRLRQRAVLRAAENYADATNRLAVYVQAAPDRHSSEWSDEFRTEFDRKLQDVESTKQQLLLLARKL